MNELVKNSIEGRKSAVYNAYDITDQEMKDKIENLFNRISEFGENCLDSLDFENKFASSELNQEYIQLFTEIASAYKPIIRQNEERNVKSDKEYFLDEAASEIRYQTRNATEPIRRKARQKTYDTVKNMPVIGEVLEAKQYMDLFNKFKKNK